MKYRVTISSYAAVILHSGIGVHTYSWPPDVRELIRLSNNAFIILKVMNMQHEYMILGHIMLFPETYYEDGLSLSFQIIYHLGMKRFTDMPWRVGWYIVNVKGEVQKLQEAQ